MREATKALMTGDVHVADRVISGDRVIDAARERVAHLAQQARDHLAPFGHDAEMLKASVDHVLHRRS